MEWEESLEGYADLILVYAHCDQRILHKPKFCEYCDEFPEAQAKRIELGINFTGQSNPDLLPCPADKARGPGHLRWKGNQPVSENMSPELKEALKKVESPASLAMYGWTDED